MSKLIIGTGSYLPEWAVTNDELEAMGIGYDRSRSGKSLDEWSAKRLGVRQRHRVRPGEALSDLATQASLRALENAGLPASALGLIVLVTTSSDYRGPNSASFVQANLDDCHCPFFQLDAVCPGYVQALVTAAALMDYMAVEYALVIGGDTHSLYCAPHDFMAQAVFGDGAGAAVLREAPGAGGGILAHYVAGEGRGNKVLWVPGGGSREPASPEMLARERQYIVWDHAAVYAFAVEKLAQSCRAVARRAGWTLDEVDWFIPHQAGQNVILDGAVALGQPAEKFILTLDHTGNTSAGSIPIALDEAHRAGKFRHGDRLVLPAMGAGLGWGAVAYQWVDARAAGPQGSE